MELRRIDIEALGTILLERAGLKLAADGEFGLAMAIKSRMQSLGMAVSANYLSRVRGPEGDQELHQLLPLVTVGKTDFFRDERQFGAVGGKLLPERLDLARSEHRALHLWSAGCATGEEPYSLAIAATEAGALAQEIDLRATDINAEAVSEAERGVYANRKLRPVNADRLRRFFVPEGPEAMRVANELKKLIKFGTLNLADCRFPTPEGGFDIIFCRNVMIYFDAATMVRVLDAFLEALRPGGYLALGYSESLYRIYNRFELVEVEGSFLYRKPLPLKRPPTAKLPRLTTPLMMPKVTPASGTPASGVRPTRTTPPSTPPVGSPGIGELPRPLTPALPLAPALPSAPTTQPPPTPAPVPPAVVAIQRPADLMPPEAPHRLSRSVELVEKGQFLEALDLLRALTTAEPESLVGWVTLGNLLTVLRRFPEAYQAYDAALSVEPLSAEARLFHGIALSEGSRPKEGMQELTRALFLDADMALAHYYLARAAEAVGDHATAKRSYKNCLSICQSGRPARPFLAHYPDLPKDPEVLGRAAQYALGALD